MTWLRVAATAPLLTFAPVSDYEDGAFRVNTKGGQVYGGYQPE